jgi:hypothetical protein
MCKAGIEPETSVVLLWDWNESCFILLFIYLFVSRVFFEVAPILILVVIHSQRPCLTIPPDNMRTVNMISNFPFALQDTCCRCCCCCCHRCCRCSCWCCCRAAYLSHLINRPVRNAGTGRRPFFII